MYSKVLVPEIMSTMLLKDFSAEKLNKPQYKIKLEKDLYVKMRDGVRLIPNPVLTTFYATRG